MPLPGVKDVPAPPERLPAERGLGAGCPVLSCCRLTVTLEMWANTTDVYALDSRKVRHLKISSAVLVPRGGSEAVFLAPSGAWWWPALLGL